MLYTIVNFTKPVTVLIALMFTLFCIIIGKEYKKSVIPALCLALFLVLILIHTYQSVAIVDSDYALIAKKSLAVDAIMIFLSYVSYLWVDDIETKEKNKKSIDNSLEWFWKMV